METALKSVDEEMNVLTAQLQSFDEKYVAGVEDLSRLDTLKVNMERCRAMLEEHSRWSQLVREARSFLEGRGRLSESADRIEIMVKSLDILQHMPGHAGRVETCAALTESLLAIVRPKLTVELNQEDVDPLLEYVIIYTKLGRQDEFKDAYITSRPVRIFEFWKTFESHYIHDSSKFISWYESFLTVCKELVQTEANNLTVLFGSEAMPRLLGGLLETSFASIAVQVAERVHLSRNPVVGENIPINE